MDGEHQHVDSILRTLGLGRWQLIQFVWLTLFYVPWACHFVSIVVLGFVPDFACLTPDRDGKKYWTVLPNRTASSPEFGKNCTWMNLSSVFNDCPGELVYNEPKESSIVSEWDLVCGQEYLSDLSQTLKAVGVIVGSIVFTPLADTFGRRKITLSTHMALLVISLASCLSPNITIFITSRVLIGACYAGTSLASWVLTLEIFQPEHRTMVALISNIVWGVSTCALPAIGFLMRGLSWRYVQLAISLLSVTIIGQYLWIDESVRWLMANGRRKQLTKVLQKVIRLHRLHLPAEETLFTSRVCNETINEGTILQRGSTNRIQNVLQTGLRSEKLAAPRQLQAESSIVSPRVLIYHPKLRRITLIMFFIWFTNSLVYGGLFMVTIVMPGDRYLNLFLTSVAEVPAAILVIPLILYFGRRKSCIILHLLAAVSLIAAILIHLFVDRTTAQNLEICAMILGKFSITGSYYLIYLYTPELYPTNLRSLGVGITAAAAQVGGLMYPFTTTLSRQILWLPISVFGALSFVAAFLSLYLPETAKKELPQSLEDLDNLKV